MTQDEYENRNLKGFEGDVFMKAKFAELITEYKIDLVIELGTYLGGTTKQLAQMVKWVVTTEINANFFARARLLLCDEDNVTMYHADSLKTLPKLFADKDVLASNVLIFIDSHWLAHFPILEELELISKSGLKPIIVIHDFKVPNHPELGYDSYNGKTLEWSYIEQSIKAIFGDRFKLEYNNHANGAMRGVAYITPLSQ